MCQLQPPESSNAWLNPAPRTIPPTSPLREPSSSEVLSTEIVISIQSDLHLKLRRQRIQEGAAHKLKPIVLLRPNSLVWKSASATLHLITSDRTSQFGIIHKGLSF